MIGHIGTPPAPLTLILNPDPNPNLYTNPNLIPNLRPNSNTNPGLTLTLVPNTAYYIGGALSTLAESASGPPADFEMDFWQFGNLPKRGWGKVGAWLGHKAKIQGA